MKKFLRKIISVISALVIVASAISGCAKPIESEVSSVPVEEESTPPQTAPIETETEGPIETETSEEEVVETPEEEIIPEKYFTYKVKYEERYPRAVIITDESFPGTLRVTLSDDLPETFFERVDCKTSGECFNQVINEVLLSLKGKKITLRDTQKGTPISSLVDISKPLEIVFKYIESSEEERGYLYLPGWDEEVGPYFPYVSYAFVQRQDGGLRFITYYSPKCLENILNLPEGRYGPSGGLDWMSTILKFHPEILGWGQINPTKIERSPEEENFSKKINLVFEEVLEYDEEQDLYVEKQEHQGILTLKGER